MPLFPPLEQRCPALPLLRSVDRHLRRLSGPARRCRFPRVRQPIFFSSTYQERFSDRSSLSLLTELTRTTRPVSSGPCTEATTPRLMSSLVLRSGMDRPLTLPPKPETRRRPLRPLPLPLPPLQRPLPRRSLKSPLPGTSFYSYRSWTCSDKSLLAASPLPPPRSRPPTPTSSPGPSSPSPLS